ncbi:MAG: hypothetical protein COT74_10215 [Bdellovibrionales bacterium CG10_big_fil_rev_8_21_14_0_10_45_34]|nr:MAG: hypothetical protein COT74_10215 [Bdellovibrionales bacterium CG10_big_fil_rev_8_21_14_0_10_45_34]
MNVSKAQMPITRTINQDVTQSQKQAARPNTQTTKNPQIAGAAKMFESQFLRQMIKEMRSTVPESEWMPASMGEKIFREQLDDHYADDWATQGGIGLADIIYDQIVQRYMPELGSSPSKISGPIPLQKDDFLASVKPVNDGAVEIRYKRSDTNKQIGDSVGILAPSEGSNLSISMLPDGIKKFTFNISQDLKGEITYQGSLDPGMLDAESFTPQTSLGTLHPTGREVVFKISKNPYSLRAGMDF